MAIDIVPRHARKSAYWSWIRRWRSSNFTIVPPKAGVWLDYTVGDYMVTNLTSKVTSIVFYARIGRTKGWGKLSFPIP